MSRCIQIVAFKIKPDSLAQFDRTKAKIAAEAHALPGLISSTTQRSLADDNVYVDTMIWESAEAAEEGNKLFESLPTTPAFLGMMAGPPVFAGHFAFSAGDKTLSLSKGK